MKVSYQFLEQILNQSLNKERLIEKMADFGLLVEESIQCDDGDEVFNFELLPHRGDMMSARGVAREIALAEGFSFDFYPKQTQQVKSIEFKESVQIKTPLCFVYEAYKIDKIQSKTTPGYIQEQLEKAGINTTNLLVDLTNWISFVYGQPCHVFDAKKVDLASFTVREAPEGESFRALNDESYQLKKGMIVIADKNQVHALAGIIGGYDSMVTDQTDSVILEVAGFDMQTVQLTSGQVGLRTDSSERFAKGTDLKGVQWCAQEYLSQLKNSDSQIQVVQVANYHPSQEERVIQLRLSQVDKILGYALTKEEILDAFGGLNFSVIKSTDRIIEVKVPSHRNDVSLECDLVEDILRYGSYSKIEKNFPSVPMSYYGRHEGNQGEKVEEKLRKICQFHGMMEWITYSFMSSQFALKEKVEKVSHPITNQMDIMRTSLIPGMMKSLAHNIAKVQTERVEQYVFYEIGKIFGVGQSTREENALTIIGTGVLGKKKIQLFLEDISKSFCLLKMKNMSQPYLKEGESALILNGEDQKEIGSWGRLCPVWAKKMGLVSKKKIEVYVCELRIGGFSQKCGVEVPIFEEISTYPAVSRDIVLLVQKDIFYQDIVNELEKLQQGNLYSYHFFDLYEGEHIPKGCKSIGISLFFQSNQRTLLDEEIDQEYNDILKVLGKSIGASLREK